MRAAWITGARQVETRTFPDPRPEGEDVVVQIEAAAICGSDLHSLYQTEGEVPFIPGHEASGVVVAVDKPRTLKVGDRVATTAMNACGVCEHCRMGYTIYCRAPVGCYGFGLNGVHAEQLRISERSLLPLPDSMTYEQGCLVLDPVGTHHHGNKVMGTNARHTVGVFGLGPMGLGAVCTSAHLRARVIGVDPVPFRRELAKGLGAWATVDPKAGDPVAQIRELTEGWGIDRGFECSGRPECLGQALDLCRQFGHVRIVGEQPEAPIQPSGHFCRKELTLTGGTCFPLGEYAEIVRLYETGLPAAKMISHRFSIEQAAEAYATFEAGETGKVIFVREP